MERILDDLPSKGKVYSDFDPSNAKIRTLKGKDEKLLAELNFDNIGKKYLALLKEVIVGINPEELTIGDRTWVILWLRANSYSPIVPAQTICESCFQKVDVEVNLTEVSIKELPENFKEPHEVKLSDGSSVYLRLLRVKDEIKIEDWEKRLGAAEAYMYRWACSMIDDSDIVTRIAKLENMEASDFNLIKAFHEEFVHGPEMDKVKYNCPKCGSEGVMTVPFRPNFLIPSGMEVKRYLGKAVQVDVSHGDVNI